MSQAVISSNIASHLPLMAEKNPNKAAVIMATGKEGAAAWEQMTYAELNAQSDRYAHGLERIGICRGVRTVLMVKPSLDFFALVFALYKVGAVIVLIDPGIPRPALKQCLGEVEPEAFIGVPLAQIARLVFRDALKTVKIKVTVGRRWFWGGHRLCDLNDDVPYTMADTQPDEEAAILFTSGSTGVPKGVVYTHGMFDAQVRMLKELYDFAPDEVDLATFPLFALFDPALGMTSVIPEMDARKPGSADPQKIIAAIEAQGCTNLFGSPALLRNLGQYGAANNIKLPTIRRALSSGAPARRETLQQVSDMFTDGAEVFTPYGATETLPVANIGSAEVLGETYAQSAKGKGICVGRPAREALVRIIRITDEPISTWNDDLVLDTGEIGEITVRGPMVTHKYYARPQQTKGAKISEDDQIVHRMGDVGYFDENGRLWMCGRKAHRVTTATGELYSVSVERIFDEHQAVHQSALVGVGSRGSQHPLLLIERTPDRTLSDTQLCDELSAWAAKQDADPTVTQGLVEIRVYPKPFPVDIRHNAKINREQLSQWAAGAS